MEVLRRPGTYEQLRDSGSRLMKMQSDALDAEGIVYQIVGDETLFDVLFTSSLVRNYRDALKADSVTNTRYNDSLRMHGLFKSPGKMYPCLALTEDDFKQTQHAIETAALALRH